MLKNNFNMGSAVQVQKGIGVIGELTDISPLKKSDYLNIYSK